LEQPWLTSESLIITEVLFLIRYALSCKASPVGAVMLIIFFQNSVDYKTWSIPHM